MAKHKHADYIIAWANGAEIEYFDTPCHEWRTASEPWWHLENKYRIKPEPKPDVVRFAHTYIVSDATFFQWLHEDKTKEANIKFTFDVEGKLKSAEIINKEK